jgi:hypothetical protein
MKCLARNVPDQGMGHRVIPVLPFPLFRQVARGFTRGAVQLPPNLAVRVIDEVQPPEVKGARQVGRRRRVDGRQGRSEFVELRADPAPGPTWCRPRFATSTCCRALGPSRRIPGAGAGVGGAALSRESVHAEGAVATATRDTMGCRRITGQRKKDVFVMVVAVGKGFLEWRHLRLNCPARKSQYANGKCIRDCGNRPRALRVGPRVSTCRGR